MVHVVAVTMVTVGSISKEDRTSLLSVYGYWKPRIELIESILYLKAKAVLD